MEEEDEVIGFLDRVLEDEDIFDSGELDLESPLIPDERLPGLRAFKVRTAIAEEMKKGKRERKSERENRQ